MKRLLAPDRPDWRWALVADLVQYSVTAALARLDNEDELTQQLFEYRRALDRGMEYRYPEMHAAYDVFMNRPAEKMQIEGLLISGADDEIISDLSLHDPDVIKYYHECFFWVRPALNKPIWINSAVFGGMPHVGAHPNDISGTVLRLAYKLGHECFAGMLKAGLMPDMTMGQLHRMTNEVLASQAAMLSFSVGSGRELPDWAIKLIEQKAEEGAGSTEDEYAESVHAFLSGFALSVADPTDERNLKLPAREARVAEYEVVNNE